MSNSEFNIVTNSRENDPTEFKINLEKPILLDETWRMAITELIIPNQIQILDKSLDFILIKNQKDPDSNPLHTVANKRHLSVLNLFTVSNFFPWFGTYMRITGKNQLQAYFDLIVTPNDTYKTKGAHILKLEEIYFRRNLILLEVFLDKICEIHAHIFGGTYVNYAFWGSSNSIPPKPSLPPLNNKSLAQKFPWFIELSQKLNKTLGETWEYLHDTIYSNKISEIALLLNLAPGHLILKYDELFSRCIKHSLKPFEGTNDTFFNDLKFDMNGDLRIILDFEKHNLENLFFKYIPKLLKELEFQRLSFSRMTFDETSHKIEFKTGYNETIVLSQRLGDILALPKEMEEQKVYTSKYAVDPYIDSRTFYLYSDVTKSIRLGEQFFPIIRTVALDQQHAKDTFHLIFRTPLFLKLNRNHITEINLVILNQFGERVKIKTDKISYLKLFFRSGF